MRTRHGQQQESAAAPRKGSHQNRVILVTVFHHNQPCSSSSLHCGRQSHACCLKNAIAMARENVVVFVVFVVEATSNFHLPTVLSKLPSKGAMHNRHSSIQFSCDHFSLMSATVGDTSKDPKNASQVSASARQAKQAKQVNNKQTASHSASQAVRQSVKQPSNLTNR